MLPNWFFTCYGEDIWYRKFQVSAKFGTKNKYFVRITRPSSAMWREAPGSKNTSPVKLLPISSTVMLRVIISTHTMQKYYPKKSNTIKHRVKETIAIKQRKRSPNRDEGLDLPAIYNSLMGIRNNLSVTQPGTSNRWWSSSDSEEKFFVLLNFAVSVGKFSI